jgi:hypothetical protein
MPVGTYVMGGVTHNEKLQVAGLALIQSLWADGTAGHVATAIFAAAALSEIYKDNVWLKIGGYSYFFTPNAIGVKVVF